MRSRRASPLSSDSCMGSAALTVSLSVASLVTWRDRWRFDRPSGARLGIEAARLVRATSDATWLPRR